MTANLERHYRDATPYRIEKTVKELAQLAGVQDQRAIHTLVMKMLKMRHTK